jgi:putative ABC transport system ATP-binding protein
MIEIDNLRFAWQAGRPPALSIAHARLAAGRSVFLHGPSGSGKSTLLGLLAGVLLPQAGQVKVLGTDWAALPASARDRFRADHVGYIFQQFNLLGYLSVLDNVLLPCRFSLRRRQRAAQAAPGAQPRAEAERLLRAVGLAEPLWQRPAQGLSVGQQQRVAAARALIGQPELLIADEPTSALDAMVRDDFMALLLGQCRASGSTLIFVSHDERLAAQFDERLALAEINQANTPLEALP